MKSLFSALIILMGITSSCTKNTISCKGTPVTDCICTKEYNPVCGCDGKTYGNACEATCAGLTSWTQGKCK